MNPASNARGLWSLDELTSSEAQALLAAARSLKQAEGRGWPLKGKHVAVLCERRSGAAADVFTAAARGLGAQVTRIRPSTSRLTKSSDLYDAAHVLGRLYDAIECDDMGEALMMELARCAAVPVSNVLVRERHPTRMLADLMAMQEISAAPFDAMTVCVIDDERAPWSVAWKRIADVTGIGVLAGATVAPPVPAAPVHGPIAFVCDPQGPRCSDGLPALMAVRRDNAGAVSLARRQVTNHRFVVQALLARTVN